MRIPFPMAESLTIDFNRPVPLFPLGTCALLPHATLPLHIFEPQYITMVEDALEDTRLIATAMLRGDAQPSQDAAPPIRPCVCIGYILHHQRTTDGRYSLLLQGVCRARIHRELRHEPYRVALLDPLETAPAMEIDLQSDRQRIVGLLDDPALAQLASVGAVRNLIRQDLPTSVLIDLSILALVDTSRDRYAMLAQPDPEERAHWLEHFLQQTRDTVRLANRFGPSRTEDGLNLN